MAPAYFSLELTEKAPHSANGHYEAQERNYICEDNSAHGSPKFPNRKKHKRKAGVVRQGPASAPNQREGNVDPK